MDVYFVGSVDIDTTVVSITDSSFQTIDGHTYFRAPMLTPRGHLFRQDDHGNLWLRFDSSPLGSVFPADQSIEDFTLRFSTQIPNSDGRSLTISSMATTLEKDVGVTAVHFESVLSPSRRVTELIYARVGGVEFGTKPTAVGDMTWGGVKIAGR